MNITEISLIILLKMYLYKTELTENNSQLNCNGTAHKNVSLTAYFPDYENYDKEGGYEDTNNEKLCSLQDYLEERVSYVTLAMDENLQIPYGTPACSPELNQHFGQQIKLLICDKGSNLKAKGYRRADICVRSELDSYDRSVNRIITLILQ